MTPTLPPCETLDLDLRHGVLQITLSRPEVKNAMNLAMVEELLAVVRAVRESREVRALVLRGAAGTFCAGADIKEMAEARAEQPEEGKLDPLARTNRRYGTMITALDRAPQATVALLEGPVMGGGFGLACVADVVLALPSTRFRLPEAGLGIPPAQISTYLVRRLGPYQTRRLVVTGAQLDAEQAQGLGLVDVVCASETALRAELAAVLGGVRRGAPGAIAVTKAIIARVGEEDHEALLDDCARVFAAAARGEEGSEGAKAFLERRRPAWAEQVAEGER